MDDIAKLVDRMAAKALADTGADIGMLLDESLGHVLRINERKGIAVDHPESDYRHITDWLVAAVVNGEHWLSRTDDSGVPVKLTKFGTFQQLLDEANKAMLRQNTQSARPSGCGDIVHGFDDGWTIVRLWTEEELDHESAQMGHCVGHGAYDAAVRAGRKSIHSLRDPRGGSHATIEIEHVDVGNLIVEQVKGKQNRQPRIDYFERVIAWLDTIDGYEFACDEYPNGWAISEMGRLVDLLTLPTGSTFHGNVTYGFIDEDEARRRVELPLPPDLTINGNLTVYGQWKHVIGIPRGLSVSGDCYIRGMTVDTERVAGRAVYIEDCLIDRLPRRIPQSVSIAKSSFSDQFKRGHPVEFGGFASLSNCDIQAALDRMVFAGDLNLNAISGLIGREENPCLTVGGDLRISRSKLKFFKEVSVGGSLSFNLTAVVWQSRKVNVGKDLILHRSDVKKLPGELVVLGSLEVHGCETIEEIPENATIGKNVTINATDMLLGSRRVFNGDLHLEGYGDPGLPNDLVVAGDMLLTNCAIEELPTGMKVGGSLVLQRMPYLKTIPDDLTVGRNLKITSPEIVTIPAGMSIPGDLDIQFQPAFTIPEGVTIGGALIAWAAGLTSLPDDLKVRDVLATESSLETLPEGFAIEGNLDISKTAVSEFPANAYIGGDVDVRDTEISEIPDTVAVCGKVYSNGSFLAGEAVQKGVGRLQWNAPVDIK